MSLQNKLLEISGIMGDRLPVIQARQEKEKKNARLKLIAEKGKNYAKYLPGYTYTDGVSNSCLIEKGFEYSPKSAIISSGAVYINGGITGGYSDAPFYKDYGRSNQNVRFNLPSVENSLRLLVASDTYRTEGKLSEAACMIEFAKHSIDELVGMIGENTKQRKIHFDSENPQVHSPIYDAIGKRALRVAEKYLNLSTMAKTAIATEMYSLAKNCLKQSKLPIDKIKIDNAKRIN